jgi:hypothetical protein
VKGKAHVEEIDDPPEASQIAIRDLETALVEELTANGGANHKLVPVTLSYNEPTSSAPSLSGRHLTASLSSVCSVSATSSEPVNGTGDGDTSPDWVIVDSHHVQLRAEGAAQGNGRVYTITVTCPAATGKTTVSVPKNKNQ